MACKKLLEKVSSKKMAINTLYKPQETFGKSFIKKNGNKYTL